MSRTIGRLNAGVRIACALAAPFFALGFVPSAQAQNTQGNAASGVEQMAAKRVSVDVEDATLASVITALMQNAGASYTLDPALRQVRVTAHLHDLPLHTTLDVLLRSVTPPMMYRVENGIYAFLPRAEPVMPVAENIAAPNDVYNPGGIRHIQVARVNFIDAAEAARLLGGIPIVTSGQTYGLVDPNKMGLVGPSSGGATGPAGGTSGAAGAAGAGAAGAGGAPGAGNASATVPANFPRLPLDRKRGGGNIVRGLWFVACK